MKYLRTAEQYENHLLLENVDVALLEMPKLTTYKSIQTKIFKDLKLDFYFVSTFGSAISLFYPVIERLLNNAEFSLPLNKTNIVLMTIYALAFLFKENKSQIDRVSEVIHEKGLGDMAKMVIESVKSIKSIFIEIAKKFGKVIRNMTELFSYTALLVPFMNCLFEFTKTNEISIKTLSAAATGLVIAGVTRALIYLSDVIYDKLKLKLKSGKTIIYDPETEMGVVSMIKRTFERVRKQLEKNKNYEMIDKIKDSIYFEDIVISRYKNYPSQANYEYSIVLYGEKFDSLKMPSIIEPTQKFFDYLYSKSESTNSVWQSYRQGHRLIPD